VKKRRKKTEDAGRGGAHSNCKMLSSSSMKGTGLEGTGLVGRRT